MVSMSQTEGYGPRNPLGNLSCPLLTRTSLSRQRNPYGEAAFIRHSYI
jgi:hypothetical protein